MSEQLQQDHFKVAVKTKRRNPAIYRWPWRTDQYKKSFFKR